MDSRILGDEHFIDRVLGRKRSMARSRRGLEGLWREVRKVIRWMRVNGRVGEKSADYRTRGGWRLLLVLESGTGTLVQLGRLTGRDPTTLSSAAKRLRRRAQKDWRLAKRMKQLLETLS